MTNYYLLANKEIPDQYTLYLQLSVDDGPNNWVYLDNNPTQFTERAAKAWIANFYKGAYLVEVKQQ